MQIKNPQEQEVKKMIKINTTITPDQKKDIDEMAEKTGLKKAEIHRRALDAYFRKESYGRRTNHEAVRN